MQFIRFFKDGLTVGWWREKKLALGVRRKFRERFSVCCKHKEVEQQLREFLSGIL